VSIDEIGRVLDTQLKLKQEEKQMVSTNSNIEISFFGFESG
jgi:hypothetical protein